MDKVFDCDFYFGDTVFQNIERFDANQLAGFKGYLKARKLFNGKVWHTGIKGLFSNGYTHYLLTGSSSYLVNWLIIVYAWLTRKKVYLWTHGINTTINKRIARFHCRLFYCTADGVFLYGQHAIPYMVSIGCNKENLHVIHNSLNTPFQTELFESGLDSSIYKEHFGNSAPVAIYIGRLQRSKRIAELLYAAEICSLFGHPVNLVIVGPIEDDDSLQELASSMRIQSSVWFYGGTYNENETSVLLYNADVCVCPGPIGLTSIHALSYGTPVITMNDFESQGPESEAIIEGKTGSFYEKGNTQSLAEHIIRWCFISKNERNAIREKARDTILKEWSVDYQIALMTRVLKGE